MKRAIVTGIVCALLMAGVAWATETWRDNVNMGGHTLTDPTKAGGGLQCTAYDNTGKFVSTGAPCSAAAITQLTHDVLAGPGSGSQVAYVVGLTDSGAVDHAIGSFTPGDCLAIDIVTGDVVTSPCGGGGGAVSSVTGTTGHISASPTTGAVVVDLIATAVTPGSYTYAAFTVDADGRLTAASSGTAPVTSVTGTAQRISVTPTTGTPVVDTIGGFYSGAVSGGNENLGGLASGVEQQVTTAGVAVLSTYQATPNDVQYGAASGGGLAQSADFNFVAGGTDNALTIANSGGTNDTASMFVSAISGGGFFRAYGAAFVVPSLANHVGFGNDTGLGSQGIVIFGNSFVTNGGAGSISIRGGGYDTAAENLFMDSTGSKFTNGAVSMPAALGAGGIVKATVTTGGLGIATKGTDYAPAGSCGPHQFVQATNSPSLVCAQPAFTDISGSLACSQLPAFTGAVSNGGGGSCATTVNFSGLTGSASCAQLPALTGAVTSSAGSCATAYAGMPASTQVAVGAGATSAPAGSANLTFSAGNLAISNTAKLSGVTVSSMLSTDSGHFVQAAAIGTGLSFTSNTLAPAWVPKLTLPYYFTNGFLAFPSAGSWLLMGGFSTTSTSPIEWGVNAPVAPTNISLNVEVIVQTLVNAGGTCNVSFIATKNGSGVGGTNITESATGHYNVTVTGQTIAVTDTFGVFMSTSAFCNGASSSLTITANLGVY